MRLRFILNELETLDDNALKVLRLRIEKIERERLNETSEETAKKRVEELAKRLGRLNPSLVPFLKEIPDDNN